MTQAEIDGAAEHHERQLLQAISKQGVYTTVCKLKGFWHFFLLRHQALEQQAAACPHNV